jgi:hypothetical protein
LNRKVRDAIENERSILTAEKVKMEGIYKASLKEKEDNLMKLSTDIASLEAENRKLKHLHEQEESQRASESSNLARDKG